MLPFTEKIIGLLLLENYRRVLEKTCFEPFQHHFTGNSTLLYEETAIECAWSWARFYFTIEEIVFPRNWVHPCSNQHHSCESSSYKLHPILTKEAWATNEDSFIIQQQQLRGNVWTTISKMLSGRSLNFLRIDFICLQKINYLSLIQINLISPETVLRLTHLLGVQAMSFLQFLSLAVFVISIMNMIKFFKISTLQSNPKMEKINSSLDKFSLIIFMIFAKRK